MNRIPLRLVPVASRPGLTLNGAFSLDLGEERRVVRQSVAELVEL
jgi:hypothetical protein